MEKKCFLCHQFLKKEIKNIKKVKILECENCRIAILDKNIKSKVGVDLYSFFNYQIEEKKLKKRFFRLAEIVLAFVSEGKLLDIGAGYGLFSTILSRLGNFRVEIIEPLVEPHYLRTNKINFINHKITYQKFLENKTDKKFDLILMIDILEHFKNPLNILKKTKKYLKNNSYLVIQTPNYQSLMAKICRQWSWWMVEDHKVIFSPKSIRGILDKVGFKVVFFKTYEDWDDFKKNLDGNFSQIKISPMRKMIKLLFFSFFIPIYFLLRQILWRLGFGGAIFLVAKRYN